MALKYWEQSLAIHQEIGGKAGKAVTCWNIGLTYQEQGNLERAEHYISRCMQINDQIDYPESKQA